MKNRNKQKRLTARITGWDAIKADNLLRGGKVKMVNKQAYTRPGSNNK